MKKIVLAFLLALPLMVAAQTKIKETAVPRSVLLALEKTYDSYKVKTWYQAPGQYVAELVIDGQNGRAYFTAGGDWQYSAFPVQLSECPTLMNTYFMNNYPGYRVKNIDYVEEMSGDNYYRMIIVKKGVGELDCEMIFDTRGKLQKSNAPDPDAVKRDYYTYNNPDEGEEAVSKGSGTERLRRNRPAPVVDEPKVEKFEPSEAIKANFTASVGKRITAGPEWVNRNNEYAVAYYSNNQKVKMEAVYDLATETMRMTGKNLAKDRYNSTIVKYLAEKYNGEKYKIEKMVVYEYFSKYRDPATGKKPKPYTYVVISQKVKGSKALKYTRMEFDSKGEFTGLLAQPLDDKDVQ
ncbi:MAG: PepSY-like domain-containing protein [Bacteroidales bacterium]|nr:PepSY-like domain-containing protein [Bacteroidales bacterium]